MGAKSFTITLRKMKFLKIKQDAKNVDVYYHQRRLTLYWKLLIWRYNFIKTFNILIFKLILIIRINFDVWNIM